MNWNSKKKNDQKKKKNEEEESYQPMRIGRTMIIKGTLCHWRLGETFDEKADGDVLVGEISQTKKNVDLKYERGLLDVVSSGTCWIANALLVS